MELFKSSEPIKHVSEEVKKEVKIPKKNKEGLVTVGALYVRTGPSAEDQPLKDSKGSDITVTKETVVEILDELDGWYHVQLASGIEGYCLAKYITIM